MKNIIISSTGEGVALRLKSFILLLVPSIITLIEIITGQKVASDQVNDLVNAIFVIAFAVIQIYAWGRSIKLENIKAKSKIG
jgi:heme/copper-type cytochrome/quinol oxidase subunit 4